MPISTQSEEAIKTFLGQWWNSLRWQAQETMTGADLPLFNLDELYTGPLGTTLRQIARAAEGNAPDTEDERIEVGHACEELASWLWKRPGMPGKSIPWSEWSATPIGWLVLRAMLWVEGDELITITQAEELTGRKLSDWSNLISRESKKPEERKRLHVYRDPNATDLRQAQRLRRSEVVKLAPKRKPKE